jgi:hypothetical protein
MPDYSILALQLNRMIGEGRSVAIEEVVRYVEDGSVLERISGGGYVKKGRARMPTGDIQWLGLLDDLLPYDDDEGDEIVAALQSAASAWEWARDYDAKCGADPERLTDEEYTQQRYYGLEPDGNGIALLLAYFIDAMNMATETAESPDHCHPRARPHTTIATGRSGGRS